MDRRYAYFYFMQGDPERIRAVAPKHHAYWQGLEVADYRGGPFADRSGGLITFAAPDAQTAEAYVAADPFVRDDVLGDRWLKEWAAD